MKNVSLLKVSLIFYLSIFNWDQAIGSELKDSFVCITYAIKDQSDKLDGKSPSIEEWIWRVVTVENQELSLKLDRIAKERLFRFHFQTISNNPLKATELANFVWYLCSKEISTYEMSMYALKLKKIAGSII